MHKKTKNAIIVFLSLAIAFGVVFSFDYTDEYVGNRFTEAVEDGHYITGKAFSLDSFLQYYEWDTVCVVLPHSVHDFKNRLGLPYSLETDDDSLWSLVFIQKNYVTAVIPIDREFMEFPLDLDDTCFDRWSAIISIDANATSSDLRLSFSGI